MFSVYLFVQVALTVAHVSASVLFQDCGSAYDLTSVSIEGCELRPPCFVTLGDTVTVNIQFFARGFVSRKLDQDVVLTINFVNLRTDVTPEHCEDESEVCPVVTNAVSSLTSIMSVPNSMAINQRGFLRWRVYNESGQQVLCYSVLVQTQSLSQRLQRQLNHTNTRM